MHHIEIENDSRITVVSANGELDAFTAPDLTHAFERSSESDVLLVDLTRVSFLDSTALGIIVKGVREHGEGGGSARVVLPRTSARRIFEITTLDRVLPVAVSRASALEDLGTTS